MTRRIQHPLSDKPALPDIEREPATPMAAMEWQIITTDYLDNIKPGTVITLKGVS